MRRARAGLSMLAVAALASCASPTTNTGSVSEVTVTGPTVTVTVTAQPPVTATAPAVTVTAPSSTHPAPAASTAAPIAGGAMRALAALPVKGRAPKSGYDRGLFGQTWSDDVTVQGGHNGCDTRNDVLRRDLAQLTLKPGSNGCTVLSGELTDPYSGQKRNFVRGPQSARVQVDHVVALSNAWQTGAQLLTADQRQAFANDPLNLITTRGELNAQKRDGDAATWLPPQKSIRCSYVARQVAVKARYQLWVTPPEVEAVRRILSGCPGQTIPSTPDTATPALP